MRADPGRAYLQTVAAEKAIASFEAVVGGDQERSVLPDRSRTHAPGRQEAARRALEKRQELVQAAEARAEERERNYAMVAPWRPAVPPPWPSPPAPHRPPAHRWPASSSAPPTPPCRPPVSCQSPRGTARQSNP